MYSVCNFNNKKSICVLCRGQSLGAVHRIAHKFDTCFLVGQFTNAIQDMGDAIEGKNIVQIINKPGTCLGKHIADKFGIKDIQCTFGPIHAKHMSKEKKKLYETIKRQSPWAKAHLLPDGLLQRRIGRWHTTGLLAVDLAAFFNPEEIYIIGMDFYENSYFRKEKQHGGINKNRWRGPLMKEQIINITNRDNNITFKMYTKSEHLKSKDNLNITIV